MFHHYWSIMPHTELRESPISQVFWGLCSIQFPCHSWSCTNLMAREQCPPPCFLRHQGHHYLSDVRPQSANVHRHILSQVCFNILANKQLSQGDSRQILKRGFQVDTPNSSTGLNVLNSGNSNLTKSIDSQSIVRCLAASREYLKYHWFLMFTKNDSESQGVQFLHQWVQGQEWHL